MHRLEFFSADCRHARSSMDIPYISSALVHVQMQYYELYLHCYSWKYWCVSRRREYARGGLLPSLHKPLKNSRWTSERNVVVYLKVNWRYPFILCESWQFSFKKRFSTNIMSLPKFEGGLCWWYASPSISFNLISSSCWAGKCIRKYLFDHCIYLYKHHRIIWS